MASLVTRKSGLRFVQFVNHAGERRTITLGKIAPREAGRIRDKIEELATSRRNGIEPSSDVMNWLTKIGDDLHSKLVTVSLADPREKSQAITLGELVARYVAVRTDWKPRTKINFDHSTGLLTKCFSHDIDIAAITPADADQFRRWLTPRLATPTANRCVGRVKQLFTFAVRKRLLTVSPFAEIKSGKVGGNAARQRFVTQEETAAVLDACPDHEWRLLVALTRFGGLRTPSEPLALQWSDVDWERNRITVHVPKLEHLPGRDTRLIPIFPELLPHLEAAWEAAPDGATHLISRYRDKYTNLRTHFVRIITKAGLKPWPRPWHNLRASRQTELAAQFPMHVVCSWIGNSPEVAAEHYLTTTELDFDRAITVTASCSAQLKAQQCGAELARIDSHAQTTTPQFPQETRGCETVQADQFPTHDSNVDKLLQRQLCYRYTSGE